MPHVSRFSMGIGDRFGRQGKAQLGALDRARRAGTEVTPVWNKSHREHHTIGSRPEDVRAEADAAAAALGWEAPYFVDADHINLSNVEAFLSASDFFTLDVADFIGQPAPAGEKAAFLRRAEPYLEKLEIPGVDRPLGVNRAGLERIADKILLATRQAGQIYRFIRERKGTDAFVTEVSMDETADPQTPEELFFILLALAGEGVPAQTIAPKFSGRFNKGVDYVGDPERFAREFAEDVAVVRFATTAFGLPDTLKLSVHSGSDKFSLYPLMREVLRESGAGVHLKTAGTTWLEEVIGLALAGGEGLALVRDLYRQAWSRRETLCEPYATVLDLHPERLPSPDAVASWTGEAFAEAVRHDPSNPAFNPDLRQLLHVGYKIAAEMGPRYLEALEAHAERVAAQVAGNLYDRHLRPLFMD